MLELQQFLCRYSNISQRSTSHLIFTNNAKGQTGWMQFIQTSKNSWACRWCHVMIISSAIRPLVLLTIMPCNAFFTVDWTIKPICCCPNFHQPSNQRSTISLWAPMPQVSAENFVLSGHQAALTYSLLYFCLQICHRVIQCSSVLLTQRQCAIRITFVSDRLLIPTRWPTGWLSNRLASCYSKSISTKPFVWSPIFRLLNYCLVTNCTHDDYWLPSSKCNECWHVLPSSSVW